MKPKNCKLIKEMHYKYGKTIRELVDFANSLELLREDIVNFIKQGDYYYLVYYYGEADRKPTEA